MQMSTKKICVLALLSALAFIAMLFGKALSVPLVPLVSFLTYDPKDVIIVIGGFLYGPLSAFLITAAVSLIEMITASATGLIGLLMNIIAGCSFACTASFIYQKNRSLKGAIIGLLTAWILTTIVMVMWNYLITPIFMNVDREYIVSLLVPGFIPFNLLKGGLNAAFAMLLYKPVKMAMKASHLMAPLEEKGNKGKINLGVIIASFFIIATCILWVLVLQGRL